MKRTMEVPPENEPGNLSSSSKGLLNYLFHFESNAKFFIVILVERNPEPNGVALVNSKRIATRNFEEMMDLEEDREIVGNQ